MAKRSYMGINGVARKIKKHYIGGVGTTLAAGYTSVRYIESTKTQFIDTGYRVKYGDIVTVDMAFLDAQSYLGYFSASSNRFGIGVAKGNYEIVNGSNASLVSHAADTERHTFVIDTTGEIRVDETVYTVSPMAADFSAAFSFALFGRKQSSANATSYRGNHRVYGFTVTNGENLIMNLVPCRREVDGAFGLFDTVTGLFHANNGTGVFSAATYENVAREIVKGYIGVNGVARMFFTRTPEYTVTILKGLGAAETVYIVANGVNYTTNLVIDQTIILEAGTKIACHVTGGGTQTGKVIINGETVFETSTTGVYEYTVRTNATIEMSAFTFNSNTESTITITETE